MVSRALSQKMFLNQIAATIRRRGWRLPVLLALEAGRPLTIVVAQLLWLAQPGLALLWPRQAVGELAELLEEPAAVELLIARLDTENRDE